MDFLFTKILQTPEKDRNFVAKKLLLCEMKRLTLITALLLLLSVSACNHGDADISRRLDIAESIMESRPDSALVVLQKINNGTLKGEKQALHALLLSQALNKNYIDVSNDSLISIAYEYYSASNDLHRQMLTNLYYARVLIENEQYGAALAMSLRAEELALQLSDKQNLARVCSQISFIYEMTSNLEKGLEYQLKDLQYSLETGDSMWICQAKKGLTDSYISTRRLNEAAELIKELETDSTCDKSWILERKIPLLALQRQYHEIVQLADNDLNAIMDLSPSTKSTVALAMDYDGRSFDKYSAILKSDSSIMSLQDSIDISATMWELALAHKDYKNAYKYLYTFHNFTCKVLNNLSSNSIHLYHIDYEKSKNRELALKHRLALNRMWSAIIITVLSLIIITTWGLIMRRKYLYNKQERESKLSMVLLEYEAVKNERDKISSEANNLRDSALESKENLLKLFTKQFEWIERIGGLYLDASLGTRSRAKAYDKLEKAVNEFRSEQFRKELENIINSYRDNLLIRVRQSCPTLIQSEINLLIYLCAGIPIRIIGLILDKNDNSIYTQKYRIRTKINNADSSLINEMKDIFPQ